MATTRPFCRRPTMFGFTEFYRVSFRPQRTFSLGSSVPSLVTEFYRVFGVGCCCCCCCRAVPCSGVVFLFWWRFIGRGRKGETAAIGHAIRSAPRTKQKTNAAATEKKRNTNHTEHVSQVDLLFKKKKNQTNKKETLQHRGQSANPTRSNRKKTVKNLIKLDAIPIDWEPNTWELFFCCCC